MSRKFSLIDMGIYEICGGGRTGLRQQNRIGKTFIMAYGAWIAEEEGMDVYCNCPTNPISGSVDHILNMPHYDYDPYELIGDDLYNVYIMTDQAEQVMDSAASGKKDVRNLVYFIYPERIPTNWHEPLRAIRLVLKLAEVDKHYYLRINNPTDYFPIYNEKVMLRPP